MAKDPIEQMTTDAAKAALKKEQEERKQAFVMALEELAKKHRCILKAVTLLEDNRISHQIIPVALD